MKKQAMGSGMQQTRENAFTYPKITICICICGRQIVNGGDYYPLTPNQEPEGVDGSLNAEEN